MLPEYGYIPFGAFPFMYDMFMQNVMELQI